MASLKDLAKKAKAYFEQYSPSNLKAQVQAIPQYARQSNFAQNVIPQRMAQVASNPFVNNLATGNFNRYALPQSQNPNPVFRNTWNIAKAVPESVINIPRNLAVGPARVANEINNARYGGKANYGNVAAGVGAYAEGSFDLATLGLFNVGKSLVKGAVKEASKQGLKKAILHGAAKGSAIGSFGGLTYGLDEQFNKEFDPGQVLKSVATGGVLGGVLGGGLSSIGAVKGLINRPQSVDKQLRDQAGKWTSGQRPVKPQGMTEPQWKFQLEFNSKYKRNPYTPIYQSDLTQAINYEGGKRVGMQARDVNLDKNPLGTEGGLGDAKVLQKAIDNVVPMTPIKDVLKSRPLVKIKPQNVDEVVSEARKQIGSISEKPAKSFRQTASDLYTQWVDRYNPVVKASDKAKAFLKIKGKELAPEADPAVLVRKLTGAGGIADYRYRTELKPVLDQLDKFKIDKTDMDVYMVNKRLAGFGDIGREVYGSDPAKSRQIVEAIEAKYGQNISDVAEQLYKYQDDGFEEMVKSGFLSPESAKIVRGQNPNYAPLQRVMDEVDNYLGLPTRKLTQGTSPIQKLKGSNRQIESPIENIIASTFKQRAAIEKNNVSKSIVDLQQITDLGFSKVSKSEPDTITVWNNGTKEFWKVGTEIADTAKGLNEENMNSLLKIFTGPASLLRQGATGRNPDFMIPNIVRDQLDAGITSKYGYIPFVDYFSGLRSMLKNDDIYQKWQKSGAKIDLGEMSGRKNIQQSFDNTVPKRRILGWLGKTLDVMGKYSEQPTRVGLFKKAYKKTGNDLLAMMESRDSTVDFARMGSKMKVANSIVPFLNVGVQGFDKLIRATKDHPGKVAFNAMVYGALPAVTTLAYNLTNHAKEYGEIPQYEKDSNFIIVTGRNKDGTVDYLKMAKGNVLPVVANPIQSFMEFMAGENKQTFGEFATQFISSTLPVVGDGQSLKEVGLKTIGSNLPQLVKPITENIVNKSFWKYDTKSEESKEIVPSYLKKKAPFEQDYEWTPQTYKAIGSVLNVSPLQVQNIMEGYLAGYTKVPSQIIGGLIKLSKGEPVSPNDTPILRRFIATTYPTSKKKIAEQEKAPGLMERITGKASAAEETALPDNENDFKVLYADAQNKIDGYKDNSSKIRTGLKDTQTLEEAQLELSEALSTIKRMEEEQPEKVYNAGLEVYESGGGKSTKERAEWAEKWLKKGKETGQFESWYEGMLESGVMSKSVLEALQEKGIDADQYVEGGEIKTLYAKKGKGKGRKHTINIKVSKPKTFKISKSRSSGGNRKLVNKTPVYKIKRYKPRNIKIAVGKRSTPAYRIKSFRNDLNRSVKLA